MVDFIKLNPLLPDTEVDDDKRTKVLLPGSKKKVPVWDALKEWKRLADQTLGKLMRDTLRDEFFLNHDFHRARGRKWTVQHMALGM